MLAPDERPERRLVARAKARDERRVVRARGGPFRFPQARRREWTARDVGDKGKGRDPRAGG